MKKLHFLLSAGTALLLHLILGWQFAVIGAVVAGALFNEKPIWAGVLTMVVCWGGLVIYNFTVATEETMKMVGIMAALIGDIPPFMTVGLTVLIAAILGAAGGWLGAALFRKK